MQSISQSGQALARGLLGRVGGRRAQLLDPGVDKAADDKIEEDLQTGPRNND